MKQSSERKWFYGYQIVAASSIIQMLYLSLMFSFGVLFKEFESEFGWSRASIAGASSMMMLMMGTLGIFLGKANDLFWTKARVDLNRVALRTGAYADVPDEHPMGTLSVFRGDGRIRTGIP